MVGFPSLQGILGVVFSGTIIVNGDLWGSIKKSVNSTNLFVIRGFFTLIFFFNHDPEAGV